MVEPVAPGEAVEHAPSTSSTMASKVSRVTSRPPKRSASDTTPTGSEVQATMWLASRGERWPRDVDQRDLGGAAADVEQHDAVGVALDQRAAARDGEPRLGLAVDDLERQARSRASTRAEELGAVLGRAAGFGGDQPRAPDRRGCASLSPQIFSASTARSIAALGRAGRSPPAPRPAGRCAKRRR